MKLNSSILKVLCFFLLLWLKRVSQAEDDYEFQSGTGLLAEGFPGLNEEPAKDLTIEPVDGAGGFANVAPKLTSEVGPGGQVWDLLSFRTRYKSAFDYPLNSTHNFGNNWFASIPYASYAGGANPITVRFDANMFRVYTTTDSITWNGKYANNYSKIVKSGNDLQLYDADGKMFFFPQTLGYKCTIIDWVGGARTSISYNATTILVLQQPNATAGSEVRRLTYSIPSDRIEKIDVEEKVAGAWQLYRRIDFTYHDEITGAQESLPGDLVGVDEYIRLDSRLSCTEPCDPVTNSSLWLKRRWVFKYYTAWNPPTQEGYPYQVRAVLGPQSVKEWQDANGSAVIYTKTTSQLTNFVDRAYTYYSDKRLKQLDLRSGCGCGGSEGIYNYPPWDVNPTPPSDLNTWSIRVTTNFPSTVNNSSRLIDYNIYGQRLNHIAQEVAGNPSSRRWIQTWMHDNVGRLTESFSYAACSSYTDSSHVVTTNGNYGQRYQYSFTGDATSVVTTVKLRLPVYGFLYYQRKTAFTIVTNGNRKRFIPSSSTSYPTETLSDVGAVTTYSYSFHTSDPLAIKLRTTTLPTIVIGENGSGSSIVLYDWFELNGLHTWTRDGDRRVSYMEYDSNRLTLTKNIVDVDTNVAGSPTPPDPLFDTKSFAPPLDPAPLHIVTNSEYDWLRRPTKVIGPSFNAWDGVNVVSLNTTGQWYYGKLSGEESVVIAYPHITALEFFNAAVTLTVNDLEGHTLTSALGEVADKDTTLTDDLLSSQATLEQAFQGTILQRTDYLYEGGRVEEERVRIVPTGAADATNLLLRVHIYDDMGRRIRTKNPAGTVTRSTYDVLNREKKTEIGTDAGTPGNMTTVEDRYYDDEEIGDTDDPNSLGSLTRIVRQTTYLGGGTRTTDYKYDYRGREIEVLGPENVKETKTYTNRNQVDELKQYDASSAKLMAKMKSFYDASGQVYETREYGVKPDGTEEGYSSTRTWRNPRGLTAKAQSQGKVLSKTQYDGAGRVIVSTTSYDLGAGESNYSSALDLSGDTVLEETRYAYDQTGAVELKRDYIRNHDATVTGTLTPPSGKSRPNFEARWYDKIHRNTHLVSYGTNGGTELLIRPTGSPPSVSSSSSLVRTFTHTLRGAVEDDVDPNGIKTQTSYDGVGRLVKRVEHFVDGSPDPTDSSDVDRTTEHIYDVPPGSPPGTLPSGHLVEVKATKAGFLSGVYYDLRTAHEYGVLKGPNTGDSRITSNDLLRKIRYPDPDAAAFGQPSADAEDQETFAYNAQGQIIWRQDQAGTVHTFQYDDRGRETEDFVPTWGGADDLARRITRSYDALDRALLVTSFKINLQVEYLANQVQFDYDKYSTVSAIWEEWTGAVTGSSPRVQYTYQFPTAGEVGIRRASTTYPGGTVITDVYNSGTDTTLNRLSGRKNGTTWIFQDTYLGLARLVKRNYVDLGFGTGVYWTLVGTDLQNNDNYAGLDRFWRIDDLQVQDTNHLNTLNRYVYTYNYDSQITLKKDLVGQVYGSYEFSESFDYDGLARLKDHKRGVESGGIITTIRSHECWTPDRAGNTLTYYSGTSATCGTTNTYTFNASHEITSRNGGSGFAAYTQAGEMLTKNLTTMTYDAWGRPVTTSTYGQATTTYDYNGLGQLIRRGSTYCYSGHCQLLEERSSPTGPVTQWFVHGSKGIDDLVYRSASAPGRWHIPDANNNTTTLIDSSGTVWNRFVYDAYGSPRQLSPNWQTWQTITEDLHLFTGRLYQRTHAQYDYRNRFYDPEVERFSERDSLGNWADSRNFGNSYLYVANDPANQLDPFGNMPSQADNASAWNAMTREYLASLGVDVYRIDIHTGRRTLVCHGRHFAPGSIQTVGSARITYGPFTNPTSESTNDDSVSESYCKASAAEPRNGWLQCACRVSGLVNLWVHTLAGLARTRAPLDPTDSALFMEKADWFSCINKCIHYHWKNKDTAKWKQYLSSCPPGVGSLKYCCDLQVEAEQDGFELCKKRCGKYKPRWGEPFAGYGPAAMLKVKDFNNYQQRVEMGKAVCCGADGESGTLVNPNQSAVSQQ